MSNFGQPRPERRAPLDVQSGPAVRVVSPRSSIAGDGEQSNRWFTIPKLADETRGLTAVLANDTELKFEMVANTDYIIKLKVWFGTTPTPDYKWALTGPASPTLVYVTRQWIVPGTTAWAGVGVDIAYTASQSIVGASNDGFISVDAFVRNGVNAGTFAFQWAQNTSDVGATTTRAQSYLQYLVTA